MTLNGNKCVLQFILKSVSVIFKEFDRVEFYEWKIFWTITQPYL